MKNSMTYCGNAKPFAKLMLPALKNWKYNRPRYSKKSIPTVNKPIFKKASLLFISVVISN